MLIFLVVSYLLQVVLALLHHYQVRTHGVGYLRPFAPALVALAVVWLGRGREPAVQLLRAFTRYRVSGQYYAFALLYPALVGLLSLAFLRLVGINHHIEFDLESVGSFGFFELQIRVALSEELAWVSFMLVALQARWRLFPAAMWVGIAWGVWYIPLVLAQVQISPGFPILPLIVNFMAIAAICAWLYQRTGSALLVFLMQVTTAYTGQVVPVLPLRGGTTQYVAFVACKCVFALALFVFWSPKPAIVRSENPRLNQ